MDSRKPRYTRGRLSTGRMETSTDRHDHRGWRAPLRPGGRGRAGRTAAARAAITCVSRRGRSRRCVCVCTRGSRPTRRTSRPRCTRRGSGWRHSSPRRRAGGSSPMRRIGRRGRSSTGPACKLHSRLARQGKIDLLLVYRVDRLSRKVRQLAQLAEELDRAGVALRSATEPFDTSAAAGRMMLQMLAVFAEFEHATIVDRITAGSSAGRRRDAGPPGGSRSATAATRTSSSSRTSGRRQWWRGSSASTPRTGWGRPQSRAC